MTSCIIFLFLPDLKLPRGHKELNCRVKSLKNWKKLRNRKISCQTFEFWTLFSWKRMFWIKHTEVIKYVGVPSLETMFCAVHIYGLPKNKKALYAGLGWFSLWVLVYVHWRRFSQNISSLQTSDLAKKKHNSKKCFC